MNRYVQRSLVAVLIVLVPELGHSEPVWTKLELSEIHQAEVLIGAPNLSLRLDDVLRNGPAYGQGEDLLEQFIRFLFPISGREKRTMFLPIGYWGEKKPQYKRFSWHGFESEHFQFYTYPEGEALLNQVVEIFEQSYAENNRIFGVENRFTKKIPVLFYQTRRDFEQSTIISGPVPEGLKGVTEIFSWRRVTFPFEGEMGLLDHVARHEGTHIYQIAKGSARLPLWFIEGTAETNSIKWDSQADMIIRDAYLNGFFYRINDLWQIQGSYLMYKQGNFITNLIWDEFGEKAFHDIFENAPGLHFDDNLKKSLDLNTEELDRRVTAELDRRYHHLLTRKDILENADKLRERETLMHSSGPFFISGGYAGPSLALFMNHVDKKGKVTREKIVTDRRFHNESLEYFQKGAWLELSQDEKSGRIVYPIKQSRLDALRIVPFSYDESEREFSFEKALEFSWEHLPSIKSPVLTGKTSVAFIGFDQGYTQLFVYDWSTNNLKKLSDAAKFLDGLDYSSKRNELIVSREDERGAARSHYNWNLYTVSLASGAFKKMEGTLAGHSHHARYAPDGKRIVFVSDHDLENNLYIYTFDTEEAQKITSARIGLLHPGWMGSEVLTMNGYEKLAPTIYRVPYPTAGDILKAQLPREDPHDVRFQDGRFSLEPTHIQEVKSSESDEVNPTQEGFKINTENEAYVVEGSQPFTVEKAGLMGSEVIVTASRGEPGSTRVEVDDLSHYFALEGKSVTPLGSRQYARKGLPEKVAREFKATLQGREWTDAWISPDETRVFAVVNNRTAPKARDFEDRDDLEMVVYDVIGKILEIVKDSPAQGFEDRLQWVAFLADGKLFMALGDEPRGPFDLYWYDLVQRKVRHLESEVVRFRISGEGDRIAWIKNRVIKFCETATGEIRDLRDVYSWRGEAMAFEFVSKEILQVFTANGDRWSIQKFGRDGVEMGARYVPNEDFGSAIEAAIDGGSGNVAIRSRAKRPLTGENLVLWEDSTGNVKNLTRVGHAFQSLVFRRGYLTYVETPEPPLPKREVVYFMDRFAHLEPVVAAQFASEEWLFVQTQSNFFGYHRDEKRGRDISDEVSGFVEDDSRIIFSTVDTDRFQIYSFDLQTEEVAPVRSSNRHEIDPAVRDGTLYWSEKEDSRWQLGHAPLLHSNRRESASLSGYDLTQTRVEDGEVKVTAYPKSKNITLAPYPDATSTPRTLTREAAPRAFRLQSLAAAAAYDGDSFRYFVSAYADNLFSDQALFVNSIFLGSAKFATVGFGDQVRGRSYAFFYNTRDNVENIGLDVTKRFILDRYRSISIYGDVELQNYGDPTVDTASFVTADVRNRRFYLLKSGAVYGYDVAINDWHGPISGSRLYFQLEAGYDVGNSNVANLDGTLDFRLYQRFADRFGLAHRLSAGTSQGDLPTVFIMGGNPSFRGVGFDDLQGQNYWVYSGDLRVPVFDFIGAKFFDPLDQFIGFLTRFFDVRSGIYTDVGEVWFNDSARDLTYSVGYFVNVPTFLGVNFRWSQGFLGETGISVWFGYNW